jgi:DNA-binding transcriptional MocR family regulator
MDSNFLYHQVAGSIEKLIENESLKPGNKLPSVRQLSYEQNVSLSTAFQAYYHLESKGLIEARPKSGYYVRENISLKRNLPTTQTPEKQYRNDKPLLQLLTEIYKELDKEDVVWLSLAVPDAAFLPVSKLKKSLQYANTKFNCTRYAEIQGVKRLRMQLAKLAFNWGGVYEADDIVITAGCMEAMIMCLQTVTRPGDAVAIQSPTYFGIFMALESLGLKAIEVKTDSETGIDLQSMKHTLENHPEIKACIFVSNFNNPLGSLMTDQQKEKLVRMLEVYDVVLIEDDIYGELYYGSNRPKTCKSFDKKGNVMYCSSLSKSIAPGFRIGWVIPGKWKDQLVEQKLIHTISTNTISQEAMAYFLEKGRCELYLKRLRKELHFNYLKYLKIIQDSFPQDIRISRPKGGFVLWLELNQKIDAHQLYNKALQSGISIAPRQLFSKQGDYRNFIRISFAAPLTEKMEWGIRMLGTMLQ